ncbi:Spo0E family sporulation regulatory protein-aspartic acid phosphatase [Clostridium sp. JNZ J1-5]|nr:aspartyl-phosphate phosphatase Spo0E family protein [Clostridium sp.]
MDSKLKILDKKIQHSRAILNALIYHNNLTDDIVLDCSKHLDKLLNEYEKIILDRKNYGKKTKNESM